MHDLVVTSDEVISRSRANEEQRLPVSAIAVIGEYTTEEWPGVDDYFMCIVDRHGTRYDVASLDAATDLARQLSNVLRVPITQKLLLDVQFASRIAYLPEYEDEPLFEAAGPEPTFLGRLTRVFKGLRHPFTQQLKLSWAAEAAIHLSKGR